MDIVDKYIYNITGIILQAPSRDKQLITTEIKTTKVEIPSAKKCTGVVQKSAPPSAEKCHIEESIEKEKKMKIKLIENDKIIEVPKYWKWHLVEGKKVIIDQNKKIIALVIEE